MNESGKSHSRGEIKEIKLLSRRDILWINGVDVIQFIACNFHLISEMKSYINVGTVYTPQVTRPLNNENNLSLYNSQNYSLHCCRDVG